MNKPYYLLGDTVRLQANFENWEGVPVIPISMKFILYKRDWTVLQEIPLNEAHIVDGYTISHDYTFNQVGQIYIEAYGVIDGTPTIERIGFEIKRI